MNAKSMFLCAVAACAFHFFTVSSSNAQVVQSRPMCPGTTLTAVEEKAILDGHNAIRKELNLRDLTWDCGLARAAQDWANNGIAEHNDDNPHGESIFVASSATEPVTSSLKRWHAEKLNWNNDTGKCSPGRVCLHYTQIVWRTTSKIGCGINRNVVGRWKTILVCNYDPAGNTGGKAY